MAQPFRLYNTLTRKVEPFEPLREGHVGLYVCGMTVYDRCHVGHARAFVVFDAFVRYLRFRGWDVTFVRNFTDVDDKIIVRAAALGEDPLALSRRYIDALHEDVDALGLLRPDHEPKVSESIEEIVSMIARLVDGGHAYAAEGSVWFSVPTHGSYGALSGQKVDELRSEDPGTGKRHPADFALWKGARDGEPAWPSPWGPGRPGWHIECSAMSAATLGETVDIHGGGLDLVFPHHENEIAQSECAHGHRYVRTWMHNGLLTVAGGQKMGKSLGNVIPIQDALTQFPAEALRLYYLQNSYRSPLLWGPTALLEALAMLGRLYEAKEAAEALGGEGDADKLAAELGEEAQAVLALGRGFAARAVEALDDDFNTARALGYAFELARAVNRFARHGKARKRGGPVVAPALAGLRVLADALGLLASPTEAFWAEVQHKRLAALGLDAAAVEARLAERQAAREARDWSTADAVRQALEASGIAVMDTPQGQQWRVRLADPADQPIST